MGSSAYHLAGRLAYGPGECILEIGAERGEGSTSWLSRLAGDHGIPFYSVDPEPGRGTVTGRAEDVLAEWSGPAPKFTWADGFDWPYSWCRSAGEWVPWVVPIAAAYQARGEELTAQASQASHLRVAGLVDQVARGGAMIVFDDTWRQSPGWTGKGGTAVPYLMSARWQLREDLLPACVDDPEPDGSYAVLVLESR